MKRREIGAAPWLVAIFFCSGLGGVGYQILWAKAFGAGIGHEYPAALAVVTAFMSGMALGGALYERLPARLQNAPSAYGWLEILIAFWGAATVAVVPVCNRFVIYALGLAPSTGWHWTVVFVAVFTSLLPATMAMGATLPAIESFSRLNSHSWTGLLYGANTAGAMLGALIAAFWAMPAFGIRNSTIVFAGLNFACGIAALCLVSAGTRVSTVPKSGPTKSNYRLGLQLLCAGLFGIGFETLMIRVLSHILEGTVYTFAILLAVYLLGTALGAAAYHRFQRRTAVSTLFIGLAYSVLASAILLRGLPVAYARLRVGFGDSLAGVGAAEGLIGIAVFLIPSFFMGATFSALAQCSLENRRSLGWSVALNSFGSALAPAVFGLFMVPNMGLKLSLAAIVLGYATFAQRSALWLIPSCVVLFPFVAAGADLLVHPAQKIAFFREGALATVAVLESTNRARVLKVNNRFQMGGTAARIAEERHADIPLLLHPQPRRALFIGLGTGITFATAAKYPGLLADGVELLSGVVEAMPLFQENSRMFENAALRVHVADGRRFVTTTTNSYDVIVGDLFHPGQDGAGFLYTREHFAAVRDRLAPGGLFCQWLPLFQMDLSTVDLIANTFQAIFPYSEMWLLRFNVDTPAIGLIGWTKRPAISSHVVEQKVTSHEELREHLHSVALADTLRLFGCRLGELPLTSERRINTDERPIVLFQAPYVTFRERDDPGARLLQLVERFPDVAQDPPIADGDTQFLRRLADYTRARDVYLRGLIEESKGEFSSSVALYIKSAKLSTEFTSGYAQALGIVTTLARRNPEAAQGILKALIEAQPDRPVARQLLDRLSAQ